MRFIKLTFLLAIAGMVCSAGQCREWQFDAGYGLGSELGDKPPRSTVRNFRVGAGFALTGGHESGHDDRSFNRDTNRMEDPKCRHWLLNTTFLFQTARVSPDAVAREIAANPQNLPLLLATGARSHFYSLAMEPTYRWAVNRWISGYGFGSVGWLRRNEVFTSSASPGTIIDPVHPATFKSDGHSAIVGGGVGGDVRLGGIAGDLKIFVEARWLRGAGVNIDTILTPISAGIRW